MWLDPPRQRYVILLTNRIHPEVQDKAVIRAFRSGIMDALVRELDQAARSR